MRARTNRRIEALAEAIVAFSGYLDPTSALYAARNPGGLLASSLAHQRDAFGNRIFSSLLDGWQALLYDLDVKLSGSSKTCLKPTDNLCRLADTFGKPARFASHWAKFVRKALNDSTVSPDTTLEFFKKG